MCFSIPFLQQWRSCWWEGIGAIVTEYITFSLKQNCIKYYHIFLKLYNSSFWLFDNYYCDLLLWFIYKNILSLLDYVFNCVQWNIQKFRNTNFGAKTYLATIIVQTSHLKKMWEVCNFHCRFTSTVKKYIWCTMMDKISVWSIQKVHIYTLYWLQWQVKLSVDLNLV